MGKEFTKFAHHQDLVLEWVEAEAETGVVAEAEAEVWSNLLNGVVLLGRGTGHGDGVLLGDPAGVFLGGGTGVFLGGGAGVVLGDTTGVAHGGGFPLGVVDPGPLIDASRGFSVLAPWPGLGWGVLPVSLEIDLTMSAFQKSSLK